MDLNKYHIRQAKVADCKVLAQMIDYSANGAATYLYENMKQELTPLDMLSAQLQSDVHYSYANALVVECNGEVVAMALSFPSNGLQLDEGLLENFELAKQRYFKYFIDNRIGDSWHLDAIYVNDRHRDNGLGSELLARVKRMAKQFGFPALQVYVFASNEAAIRFYLSNDFSQVKKIDLADHEFLGQHRYLLQMQCKLNA